MYIYIYIYICTHTYICIYICTYMYIYMCICQHFKICFVCQNFHPGVVIFPHSLSPFLFLSFFFSLCRFLSLSLLSESTAVFNHSPHRDTSYFGNVLQHTATAAPHFRMSYTNNVLHKKSSTHRIFATYCNTLQQQLHTSECPILKCAIQIVFNQTHRIFISEPELGREIQVCAKDWTMTGEHKVWQCVAAWCNVVQCGAVCCSVLQCVAVCLHYLP